MNSFFVSKLYVELLKMLYYYCFVIGGTYEK